MIFGVGVLSALIGAGIFFALDLLVGARSMRRQPLPPGWRWEITRDGFVLEEDAHIERGRITRSPVRDWYGTSRGGLYRDVGEAMARVESDLAMVQWRREVP